MRTWQKSELYFSSVKFSSVPQSCLTLCDPMNHSSPGLPVHHQLLESTQSHVHWVSDAIQLSHPLSSPSPHYDNYIKHFHMEVWNGKLCCAKLLQLCPTLCDPMDCSLSGSSVHGTLQARILECVIIPFSRGSSWPRNQALISYISCIGRWVLYH